MENIKWGQVVLWVIIGAVIVIAASSLYVILRMVVLGFQMGGNPPSDAAQQFTSGPAIITVVFVAAALAGFLGGRGPARKAEGSYLLNGILAGVLIAVLSIIWSLIGGGGVDWGMFAVAAVVVAFSALGAWVGGRAAEAEAYD